MKLSKSTLIASRLAVPAGGLPLAAALAFSRLNLYAEAARHGGFSA